MQGNIENGVLYCLSVVCLGLLFYCVKAAVFRTAEDHANRKAFLRVAAKVEDLRQAGEDFEAIGLDEKVEGVKIDSVWPILIEILLRLERRDGLEHFQRLHVVNRPRCVLFIALFLCSRPKFYGARSCWPNRCRCSSRRLG